MRTLAKLVEGQQTDSSARAFTDIGLNFCTLLILQYFPKQQQQQQTKRPKRREFTNHVY